MKRDVNTIASMAARGGAMSETLSDRVARLCTTYYPSERQASIALGMPHPSLKKIRDGKSRHPRANTLMRIAEHFRCSVEWLLYGTGPAPLGPEKPITDAARVDYLLYALRNMPGRAKAIAAHFGGVYTRAKVDELIRMDESELEAFVAKVNAPLRAQGSRGGKESARSATAHAVRAGSRPHLRAI